MPKIVDVSELKNLQIRTSADTDLLDALRNGSPVLFAEGESVEPYRRALKAEGYVIHNKAHRSGGRIVSVEYA